MWTEIEVSHYDNTTRRTYAMDAGVGVVLLIVINNDLHTTQSSTYIPGVILKNGRIEALPGYGQMPTKTEFD